MSILDILRPATKRKTRLGGLFVPVIFANDHDDDLPGLTAAIENRAVQFDDKIYKPGEPLRIVRRTLAFSCLGLDIRGPGDGSDNVPDCWALIVEGRPSRPVHIAHCTLRFGLRVTP